MANQDEVKRKLILLANRVKKANTTYLEDLKIDQAVKTGKLKSKADISRVLEESLNKTASEVSQVFASDNTDKLVDEIVSMLGK